jgi:hypothetical protein
MSSRLWVELHEKWQIEPVTEGRQLSPYHAAALAGARLVWSA